MEAWRDCERLIEEMLQRREQWGEFVPLRGEELDEEYLDGWCCRGWRGRWRSRSARV